MAKQEEEIIRRNPWLDKEYKQGLPLFTREPGLEIDDLPERLGLLDEVTVKDSIEATKFIELADTPSDYGLKKQFPMSDGEGAISWAYPFWKPTGSSIYFRKRVAVGHSHPMVEFHVYKPQTKVQVRIGAKENPWIEWESTDETNGFAAGIADAANKLFKINYDSPIGTASQLFLCLDAGNTRVGVYTASPQVPYHIKESACASATYHVDAILAVESTTNAMIQVSAGTDAGIVFCDDDSNPPAGGIVYDHANEQMEFIAATNERMWLSSVGILRTHGDYIHNDSGASSSFRADAHDADAYVELQEDATLKWTIGFDYTDSLALVISEGLPGAANRLRINPTTGAIQLPVANQNIQFLGTVGGAGGIQYLDSGSTVRYGLLWAGSDVVALCNRAANGTVQLRANTSTAGSGGEITVVTVEDDNVTFGQTFTGITGSTIGTLTLGNASIVDSGGSISFGDENLTTTGWFRTYSAVYVWGTAASGFDIIRYNTGTGAKNVALRHARGTEGSETTLVSGDYLGTLGFSGHDGTEYLAGANIRAITTAAVSTGTMPTDLLFGTGTTTVAETMRLTRDGNLCLGCYGAGTNAVKVLAIGTGTAPTSSLANRFTVYSADQAGGNACLHTRTENGAIIKLYQQALIVDPAGQANDLDSEARTAINSILDLLENNGLMANA